MILLRLLLSPSTPRKIKARSGVLDAAAQSTRHIYAIRVELFCFSLGLACPFFWCWLIDARRRILGQEKTVVLAGAGKAESLYN